MYIHLNLNTFKFFSFGFQCLTPKCLIVVFFSCNLFEILKVTWMCGWMSFNGFGKCLVSISSNITFVPLSLFLVAGGGGGDSNCINGWFLYHVLYVSKGMSAFSVLLSLNISSHLLILSFAWYNILTLSIQFFSQSFYFNFL